MGTIHYLLIKGYNLKISLINYKKSDLRTTKRFKNYEKILKIK